MSDANEPTGTCGAGPDEIDTAVWTLLRLSRMIERAQTELTVPQYRVLRLVGAGEESSARVADRLSVRRPTLTAAADGLVASGYLAREPDPSDRRVVRLCLTPSGSEVLDRTNAALRERLGEVLAGLPAPDRLFALLGEVGDALDARRAAREAESMAGRR
jgi:DNA-binding MarR family transcriptional regulator